MSQTAVNRPSPSSQAVADARASYERAVENLARLQSDAGSLAGEVVWNPMLTCQYVFVFYVLGRPIPEARKRTIRRSLEVQQLPDGGWGMHPDSEHSWLFHTTLGYVALRLIGTPPDDPMASRAREWIHDHGGAYANPTWGRIWLALLGLYPWRNVQPVAPEIWLAPESSPIHPKRLYCHMRLIYLGLSYIYGTRLRARPSPLLEALRDELYPEGYSPALFDAHQHRIADTDLFEMPAESLNVAFSALRVAERLAPRRLRRRALERAMEHILFEFESTDWVCISPVNGLLFTLALHAADPSDPRISRALQGVEYWVWEDDDEGMRICGAKSDIWDTAFAVQALCEGPDLPMAHDVVERATGWLPRAQMQTDLPNGRAHYRAPARGGWGFADEHHPWPVSDCTAESLEALMHAHERGWDDGPGRISAERRIAAVEFILLRQNDDGGFGSYEARRGPMWLKRFNPSEIYGNCMVEYSYTECTASSVRALALARRKMGSLFDAALRARVDSAIDRGVRALLGARDDTGAWPGMWGIQYTYGTMFALQALLAAGVSPDDPGIREGCDWLVRNQRPDGGWGEDWKGMVEERPIPIPDGEKSVMVQTAWALLALMAVDRDRYADTIARGIQRLVTGQDGDGSWPTERSTGIFFNTAVLEYRLYRHVFPAWALARWLGSAS